MFLSRMLEYHAVSPVHADCEHCENFATILLADNTMSTGALVQPTATTTGGSPMGETQQSESSSSLAALGGGLGGLCAILAILLVGVVIGWVWTCHKQREKLTAFQEG